MPEPFKNVFSQQLVTLLAKHIKNQYSDFDDILFCEVINENLEQQELKERSRSITKQLDACLPKDYKAFSEIIISILHPQQSTEMLEQDMDDQGVRGWVIMPLADLVTKRSLPKHFQQGMLLLKALTCRFTAELAIREFIVFEQHSALALMREWTQSENEHVRRLSSEGCRPRLPWAIQIKSLIEDPTPLRPILEALVDDESEYVRRSVANNLNDIAKDHPDFVIWFVTKFLPEASSERFKLLKHASRTLIKQGNKAILALFGYGDFAGHAILQLDREQISIGQDIWLSAEIRNQSNGVQKIMLDYVVWYTKADGKLSPKVFKWKNFDLGAEKSVTAKKKHSFKPVTTRKYYPGKHKIQLQINGQMLAEQIFDVNDN